MESFNPLDYLIDQGEIDWKEHLQPWQYLLPQSFTIWIVNRFGDLFMVFEDESLHHLDIQLGKLTKRGENKKDFLEQMLEADHANDWLYMNYVNQAQKAGMTLPQGHCYSFKIPPILSGAYALDNLCTIDLAQHYSTMADIHQQIKGLPDGATVTLSSNENF